MTTIRYSSRLLEQLDSGLAGPFSQGFREELLKTGFSHRVVCRHLRALAHLACWLKAKDLSMSELDERYLEEFCRHLPYCRCAGMYRDKFHTAASARRFLAYFRRGTVITAPSRKGGSTESQLFKDFCHWMRTHRGALESTLGCYRPFILSLLQHLGEDPSRFHVRALRSFLLLQVSALGSRRPRSMVTALRMFFRYLVATGKCPADLSAALPKLASRYLASLPHYLSTTEVEKILAACNPATPAGTRNRAIVLLCARLGLRSGDILELRLRDIDWQQGSLRLCGKGRRDVRLPLTQEVGDALLAYLERARPPLERDYLFVTSYPPWRPLARSSSVSSTVARLMRRAGVKPQWRGAAHLLRYSAATEMLRQGHSLQDIGAVLRHRSILERHHVDSTDRSVSFPSSVGWIRPQT